MKNVSGTCKFLCNHKGTYIKITFDGFEYQTNSKKWQVALYKSAIGIRSCKMYA